MSSKANTPPVAADLGPAATPVGATPATHAAQHWGLERAVALAAFALLVWLAVSLLRLPTLDHAMVVQWLKAPLVAVPMLLLIVAMFWHLTMGLVVVVEDYVHEEGSRLIWLGLIHFSALFVGALALFAVLKIALSTAAAGAHP